MVNQSKVSDNICEQEKVEVLTFVSVGTALGRVAKRLRLETNDTCAEYSIYGTSMNLHHNPVTDRPTFLTRCSPSWPYHDVRYDQPVAFPL